MRMEQGRNRCQNKSEKVNPGEENSPAAPAGTQTHDFLMRVWCFNAELSLLRMVDWVFKTNLCLQGPGPQQVEVITDVNDIKEPDDRSSLSSSSFSSSSSSYSNKKTDEMTGLFNLVD